MSFHYFEIINAEGDTLDRIHGQFIQMDIFSDVVGDEEPQIKPLTGTSNMSPHPGVETALRCAALWRFTTG